MKMARWVLQDNQAGEVFILKGESPDGCTQKSIYKTTKTELKLLYTHQNRMIGYLFKYKNTPQHRFSLFNAFGVIYNKKKEVNPNSLSLEIIYEDQVIRLLAYEHPDRTRDYMLVGRWRTEHEMNQEDTEETETMESTESA